MVILNKKITYIKNLILIKKGEVNMRVYELIALLQKEPQFNKVKIDDGQYVNDIEEVETDHRDYTIIRPL